MLVAAEQGTLLLNEISEMPQFLQAELQRLLESGEMEAPKTNVRFISTTGRRIDQLVGTKAFRSDLSHRLNSLPLEVPPLRRHRHDVPILARYFLSHYGGRGRRLNLSEEAAAALSRYAWPGNVRELKSALEFAAAGSVDEVISPSHLPESITDATQSGAEDEPFASSELNLARLERQAILRALQISGFDKTKTARLLGIGKTTMYRKLKEMSGKRPASSGDN